MEYSFAQIGGLNWIYLILCDITEKNSNPASRVH